MSHNTTRIKYKFWCCRGVGKERKGEEEGGGGRWRRREVEEGDGRGGWSAKGNRGQRGGAWIWRKGARESQEEGGCVSSPKGP